MPPVQLPIVLECPEGTFLYYPNRCDGSRNDRIDANTDVATLKEDSNESSMQNCHFLFLFSNKHHGKFCILDLQSYRYLWKLLHLAHARAMLVESIFLLRGTSVYSLFKIFCVHWVKSNWGFFVELCSRVPSLQLAVPSEIFWIFDVTNMPCILLLPVCNEPSHKFCTLILSSWCSIAKLDNGQQ